MNVNGISGSRPTGNTRRQTRTEGFAGELAAAVKASAAEGQGVKRAADSMSDIEYEKYIYSLVDKMPRSGHSKNDDWIIISKEGLSAMKSDPDYEKWVLDKIYKQVSQPLYLPGNNAKVHNTIFIGGDRDSCKFEAYMTSDRMTEDGFSGPTHEEIRREHKRQAKENEKLRRYARTLRDNSIEKADMELEHIRGVYRDELHSRKNICAVLGDIDRFWLISSK